ncbi:MAG: MFS transporter [Chloroflexi bacterium]|nr:MFS transporter [Chloroflexota bacterium]
MRPDAEAEGLPTPAQLIRGVAAAPTFASLHDRDFRWFFFASLSQNAAMNMQMLARGFLVFWLTGSYAALGTLALVHAVSMLAFSLYGGVLADGRSKRMILQLGQIAAALNAAAVATLLFADLLRWEHLLIAAFAQGITSGLMMPARQAMPPEIVQPSLLQNAVSLNTANMNVMRLLGPALAGVLLAVTEAEWVYTIMTALFVLSIILLARVPKRAPQPRSMSAANVIRELREGFSYIRRTPTVFSLLAIGFTTSLLGMPYIRLMPGFVADVLNGDSAQLGILMSLAGLGSLTGALALASLRSRRRGRLLLLSMVVMGLGLTAFSASTFFALSIVLMFVVGIGEAGRQALNVVLIHQYADDAYRGRVMSVLMTQVGTMALGAFIVGLIAEVVGPQVGLGSFAVLLVLVAIVVHLFVPRVREIQ